jgi:preprotein translocase subunit SecD
VYGSRRRLDHVPIGKIWLPQQASENKLTTIPSNKDGDFLISEGSAIDLEQTSQEQPRTASTKDIINNNDESSVQAGQIASSKSKNKRRVDTKKTKR